MPFSKCARATPLRSVAAAVLILATGCTSGTSDPTAGAAPTTGAPTTATAPETAPPPTIAPTLPQDRLPTSDLQAWADRLRTASGSEGGIVALQYGRETATVVTTGVADPSVGRAIAPDDPISIGAVTESFTAALALMVSQDGELVLKDPISRWLSWPAGDQITALQLLRHRSGVALFGTGNDGHPTYDRMVADPARRYSPDDVLAAVRMLPPQGEPGKATTVNPMNYVLLGTVLEAAADATFGDLLHERVTGPLGLTSTWYRGSGPTGPAPAPGTVHAGDGVPPARTAGTPSAAVESLAGPAGAMVSSVPDLLRWADTVFRGQVVPDKQLAQVANLAPTGVGFGILGVTGDGPCARSGCPPDASFTRVGLYGDHPGSTVRIVHDQRTDVLLVVYLNQSGIDVDAALISLLDEVA